MELDLYEYNNNGMTGKPVISLFIGQASPKGSMYNNAALFTVLNIGL